jgi:hypothetical protein
MADDVKTQEATTPEASKDEVTKVEKTEGEKSLPVSAVNKIVQERIAEVIKKQEVETTKKVEEAVRLEKMTAAEREKELARKRDEELAQKENELTIRENKLVGVEKLAQDEIPTDFIDFLVDSDATIMDARITTFRDKWSQGIAKAVEKKLKGEAPKDISTTTNSKPKAVTNGISDMLM